MFTTEWMNVWKLGLGNSTLTFPTKNHCVLDNWPTRKWKGKTNKQISLQTFHQTGELKNSQWNCGPFNLQVGWIPGWLTEVTHCFPSICLTANVTLIFSGKEAMYFWFRWVTVLWLIRVASITFFSAGQSGLHCPPPFSFSLWLNVAFYCKTGQADKSQISQVVNKMGKKRMLL